MIGADPVGSSTPTTRCIPASSTSADFWPQTFDASVVDRYVTVSDRDSFLTTPRLAAEEGLLVGGSCGLAVHAALQIAQRSTTPTRWWRRSCRTAAAPTEQDLQRRLDAPVRLPGAQAATTVGDVLREKTAAGEIPPFVTVQITRRSGTRSACCTSTACPSCRWSVAPTSPRSSAASAKRGLLKRDRQPGADEQRHRRRDGAAVPGRRHRRPGARGGRAPERRPPGADRDRGRPAGRDRHPRRPAGVARPREPPVRHPRRPRGPRSGPGVRDVVPAIHQASTYVQPSPGESIADYDYSRSAGRPARRSRPRWESWRAATGRPSRAAWRPSTLITAVAAAGDHIVIPNDLYGGTYRLVDKVLNRWGLSTRW